jgi:hypothetical protein
MSMGNQAYQNTSAFQHNTSPTYNASQFKSMGASGVEQSTFADGTQAFNDQAMSHLSVQIMGTENTSFAEQKSLNHARNVAETMSTAATQATEAAIQDSTNFLSRFGSEEFKGEDFSKTLNASQSESLQNFKNHIHDICKKTDWNETQAVEAVIGASIGSPKLLGIGASGNFSSTAARQQAIHDANSIATQTGYSENTEKILSAAQAFTEGTRDTTGTELGKSASSSLNTAKSLREEAMVAHNTVDSISKDMSSSQSKGLTISKELTQEVLEFIAHQPTNPGPDGASGGEIGYKEARRIIENGGDERASYLKHFQEAHPQYTIQSINVAGAQSALQTQYETQAQQHRNDAGIQAQHQANTQDVQHQANAAGVAKASLETRLDQANLDQTGSSKESIDQTNLGKTTLDQKSAESPQKEGGTEGKAQSIKSFVEQQFAETENKIKVGHEKIGKKEEPLQTAEKASQEKTLGVTAVKNLVVSGGEGVLSVGKDVLTAVEKHPPHEASPYFAGWSQQGLQGEQKQASSMENPGQVTGNSQLATVLQSEPSQTPQTSQTHQAGLSQNQSQNTQEILNQSNGMGVSSHNNASTPSVERAEQGRQTQQTKQETSENQHQQVSMSPSVQQIAGSSQPVAASQGTENSQFATASQGGSPQILQTPQTSQTAQPHQAVSSQNHAHNTPEILNQGNGMGVSSYNASTPSVERVEQERQSQQTKQGTSGNQQKQLSPKTPIQSVGKSKSSSTSQEGVSQTLQTFKEEGNSSFKNSDSKIAQSDFAPYIKPPAIGHQSSEKKGEKPK